MQNEEEQFKKGRIFVTHVLNFDTKKLNKEYYKILSIRCNKCRELQGFKVQRCQYKLIKTIVVPIDDAKDKKLKKQDVYELKEMDDKPFYYKYIYMHWRYNFSNGSDRILSDDELIKQIDRN
jgi:hypothetical protein